MAKHCPYCNDDFISDMAKCPHCGARLSGQDAEESSTSEQRTSPPLEGMDYFIYFLRLGFLAILVSIVVNYFSTPVSIAVAAILIVLIFMEVITPESRKTKVEKK